MSVEIADVQAKLGAMMLQALAYERRIAELEAALAARGSSEGPARPPSHPSPLHVAEVPDEIRMARGELDEAS